MTVVLLVIFVLICVLLILLVLLQKEGGDSMGGIFGGGGGNRPLGAHSGNLLTRITTGLGVFFFLISLSLAWINRTPETTLEQTARELQREEGVQWWNPDEEESP